MVYGFEIQWPLIIITADGIDSEEEMNNLLNDWSNIYTMSMQNNEKHKLLIDVRKVNNIELKYLIMIGKFLAKVKPLSETWLDKVGILLTNQIIRLLIKFVFKIHHPIRPFYISDNPEETLEWVLGDQTDDKKDSIDDLIDNTLLSDQTEIK